MRGPPLTFNFLPGLLVPFLIPLFPFSSFLHPFRCWKSSTNVQQVLYENCSICRCILGVLARSYKFRILLFCHLNSFPLGVLWCHIIFKSLSHFEFIFVYGVRECSNSIELHAALQLSQQLLLKRQSFLHCISLPPLS